MAVGGGATVALALLIWQAPVGAVVSDSAAPAAGAPSAAAPATSSTNGLVPDAAVTAEAAATIAALSQHAPEGALATSAQGLGAFPVQDVMGSTVAIAPNGEPSIVMINSRTCGYCKQALHDLAQYARGRPAPGLRMLTLEGAVHGAPMLAEAGLTGVVPLGPATSESQILLTFRYRGTPTFVAVDAEGRIRGTLAGYPGAQALAPWFDVMLGDRAAP